MLEVRMALCFYAATFGRMIFILHEDQNPRGRWCQQNYLDLFKPGRWSSMAPLNMDPKANAFTLFTVLGGAGYTRGVSWSRNQCGRRITVSTPYPWKGHWTSKPVDLPGHVNLWQAMSAGLKTSCPKHSCLKDFWHKLRGKLVSRALVTEVKSLILNNWVL